MGIRFAALYAHIPSHPNCFSHLENGFVQVPTYGFELDYAVGSVANRVRTDVGRNAVVSYFEISQQTRSILPYM